MADFLARIDGATAGLCIASTLFGVAVGYILSTRISGKKQINTSIKKDCSKVVDCADIEELAKGKTVYCRCWQSKKFPYCDGAHNKYNAMTGDNVGPLVINKE